MNDRTKALVRDIDTFLKLTGMKPTRFGQEALNDPALYGKLKNGRRVWEDTEQKVRNFMQVYAQARAMKL